MTKKKTFISFDYDNDYELRDLLLGQADHPDSPFEIKDSSLREPLSGNWQEKIRQRIKLVDVVIVMCGLRTDSATGVSAELAIARQERIPYFLLKGRREGNVKAPQSALPADKIYEWSWDNLKLLIEGRR